MIAGDAGDVGPGEVALVRQHHPGEHALMQAAREGMAALGYRIRWTSWILALRML